MKLFRLSETLTGTVVVGVITGLLATALFAQTERHVYSFQGGSDGNNLVVGVVSDSAGNLYGTTSAGGTGNNGTIFQLTPSAGQGPWTKTVLYNFPKSFGASINSLLIDQAGNLYGTTFYGGQYTSGIVFQLAPPAQLRGQLDLQRPS